MNSSTKLIAVFAFATCLAWSANAGDDNLEDRYAEKFGNGVRVEWKIGSSMTEAQRVNVCKSVHEQTGYGPAQIKDTRIVQAYLRFTDYKKYKPVFTDVLACKKNNQHQYTFYVTQGVEPNAVTLIHLDPSQKKIHEKDVFKFWWIIGQVRTVPQLKTLSKL